MRIDQFVHTLQYGDAISAEAVTLRDLFRAQGLISDIYSVHAHEKMRDLRRAYSEFSATSENAAHGVILHYSIASPLNELFVQSESCFRVLLYHNLTPERFFRPYNARVVTDLLRAREGLSEAARNSDLVLADSTFNQSELIESGFPSAEVFPLVFDPNKWNVDANPGIAAALRGHGGKNILHVGRIAPNKCIEDIIRAFYFYAHKIEPKSRLWLVGSDTDTEIYSFELRKLVRDLRLEESVNFVGSVSDGELRAFYENSDAYLVMSEHEGFCVPLLEAMSFRLPVIAYASSAVPETVGDAALLVSRKDPSRVAELLHLVLHDEPLRTALIESGVQRSQAFGMDRFAARVDTQILKRLRSFSQTEEVSRASNRS